MCSKVVWVLKKGGDKYSSNSHPQRINLYGTFPMTYIVIHCTMSASSVCAVQVRVLGKMVIIEMNGGWTYPGVNYILKRVFTEVTSVDDCPNSESECTHYAESLWLCTQ